MPLSSSSLLHGCLLLFVVLVRGGAVLSLSSPLAPFVLVLCLPLTLALTFLAARPVRPVVTGVSLFALARLDHLDAVFAVLAVAAQQVNPLALHHVLLALPFTHFGLGPHLDELGVPRQVPDGQAVTGTHHLADGLDGRAEAIRDETFGPQFSAPHLHICKSERK